MMTQGWKQPQPPRLIAINVDPADAAKNYLPDVLIEADAARRRRRPGRAGRGARRAGLALTPRRAISTGPSARGARRERPGGARLPPGDGARAARRRRGGLRHVHPRLLAGRIPRARPRPRKLSYPLGWGTLGCAFPQGLGAALAGRRAGGERLGRRRLPLRLRRAGDRRAGAHPAHRRDRGRRRLRDAALRPGPQGRPARGRRPRPPRLRGPGATRSACAPTTWRAWASTSRACSATMSACTSPPCWWHRPPSPRRPTPRRAGIASERAAAGPPRRRVARACRGGVARGHSHAPGPVIAGARPILHSAVSAALAWLIATEVVGHDQPFFAPIAAVITLGLTVGQRRRRAMELAIGVAVGHRDRRRPGGRDRHRHLADRRDRGAGDGRRGAGGRGSAAGVAGRRFGGAGRHPGSRPRAAWTSAGRSTRWSAAAPRWW